MERYKFIPNDNKSVIRMLAGESGRCNKGRNRILMGAVSMCIITLTMVFGIAFGKVKAEYIRAVRAAGTCASACIEGADRAQYGKVSSLSYVKQVGRCIPVGEGMEEEKGAAAGERICWIQVLDKPAWDKLVKPAYTDICGYYPVEKQEIMLPVKALREMGIDEPRKGMRIPLAVNIGLFRTEQEEFVLSGWYTDYADIRSDLKIGYISEEKCKDWGYDIEKKSDILIRQSDYMDWRETERRLYEDLAGDSEIKLTVRNTFFYDAVNGLAGGYGMAVLGALVILGGMFLLIYNVMHISLAGDVRQMGLLNILGTTGRQICKIYFAQIISILIPGVVAGTVLSLAVLRYAIPEILGNQYLSRFGGAAEADFFSSKILIAAIVITVVFTIIVSVGVIYHVVNSSCVESVNYTPPVSRKRRTERVRYKRRSADGELYYMAWQNLTRHRKRFFFTVFSLFLGAVTFMGTVVVSRNRDYVRAIEKRPDFLIAGEFSGWGQEEGYGNEYRFRDAKEDPMETEGDNFYLLYGNAYDEFSPVSLQVREGLLNLDGVKKETSYVMEGAYMLSTMSRKGIRPLADNYDNKAEVKEGIGYSTEYSMVEGVFADVIQILSEEEIADLRQYVEENNLLVDMDSLENGSGVAVLHDHRLSPEQEKAAEESVGEPVYFTAMRSKAEQIAWNQISPKERELAEWAAEEEGRKDKKKSEIFSLSGYLDNRAEGFPHIRQTWHGAEGSIYYLISEKGFEKLPTAKKTLYMELDADEEKEPEVKRAVWNIVLRENRRRKEMSGTGEEDVDGEAGVFVISRSELLAEAENDIRGNRMILGSISAVLLAAALANYVNVMVTGVYARKKEFEIMESIGMTGKQRRKLLAAEGAYYFLLAAVLVLTAGNGILRLLCLYMSRVK